MGGHGKECWLVTCEHECAFHAEPLSHQVQLGIYDIPQLLVRFKQGDQQDIPQFLGFRAWVQAVGCHSRVQAGQDMEACASHNVWGVHETISSDALGG